MKKHGNIDENENDLLDLLTRYITRNITRCRTRNETPIFNLLNFLFLHAPLLRIPVHSSLRSLKLSGMPPWTNLARSRDRSLCFCKPDQA
jgi:hypothetical protein